MIGDLTALLAVLLALGVYFAPTLIAMNRNVPNQGSVFVINLFLGWTLIGWVVALAMAARTKTQPVRGEVQGTYKAKDAGRFY